MSVQVGLYAKAINAAALAGAAAALTGLQDGQLESAEVAAVAGAVLVTFSAVGFARNARRGPLRYVRAALAAVGAALGALTSALADGWPPSTAEWVVVGVALLSALPVAATSDAAESDEYRADAR